MTYTQTYTHPFGVHPCTTPTRPTRPEVNPVVNSYTGTYTAYTRHYLHVSHPLYKGGNVGGRPAGPSMTVSGTQSGHTEDTVSCQACGEALNDVDGLGVHPGCEVAA